MEGVAQFKYLGRPMDKRYYNWLVVCCNIKRQQKVWGRLVKILQWKCVDIKVLVMFYKVVVKAVLQFVSKFWSLLTVMDKHDWISTFDFYVMIFKSIGYIL